MVAAVQLFDAVHQLGRTYRHPGRVTVTNSDTVPPLASSPRSRSEPLLLGFDEDVAGISTTSAPVTYQGQPVSGAWHCAGAAGATVDCGTGRVRQALFIPAAGQARPTYSVELNPDHVLDVVDLAGTPIGQITYP